MTNTRFGYPFLLSASLSLLFIFACADRTSVMSETMVDPDPEPGDFTWVFDGRPTTSEISEIIVDSSNTIYIGTSLDGVFRKAADDSVWTQINNGLFDTSIISMTLDRNNNLFAGTPTQGLYRYDRVAGTWRNLIVPDPAIWEVAVNSNGHLFATTFSGAFRSLDSGETWTKMDGVSDSLIVFTIAVDSEGNLVAGTNRGGILRSLDNGTTWLSTSINELAIRDIKVDSNDRLFAATFTAGILISEDNGQTWNPPAGNSGSQAINQLTVNSIDYVFMGAQGSGVFRSEDNGNNWRLENTGLDDRDVNALAVDKDHRLIAGTTSGNIFITNYRTNMSLQ